MCLKIQLVNYFPPSGLILLTSRMFLNQVVICLPAKKLLKPIGESSFFVKQI